MKRLLIITDEEGHLLGKLFETRENHASGDIFDINKCRKLFEQFGFCVTVKRYVDFDPRESYGGYFVIYSSSEDRGLFRKDYYEDVLLWLNNQGAVLIPRFELFRAHHNKVYQEFMRGNFKDEMLRHPISYGVYNYKFINDINPNFPCVLKASAGAGSRGVIMASDEKELLNSAKYLSKIKFYNFWYGTSAAIKDSKPYHMLRTIKKTILNEAKDEYKGSVLYNNKYIVQEFIDNLSGDYKVLFYYHKYYVLHRLNRDDDFRASGSGKFEFPQNEKEIIRVLEFAKRAVNEIDAPILSLDIGDDGKDCYLLEFQAVDYGNYTIQFSDCYFEFKDGKWTKTDVESDVEYEYCRSISQYIEDKHSVSRMIQDDGGLK